MKILFRTSFLRDLKKIRDPAILATTKAAIEQVEQAGGLDQVPHLRKLSGTGGLLPHPSGRLPHRAGRWRRRPGMCALPASKRHLQVFSLMAARHGGKGPLWHQPHRLVETQLEAQGASPPGLHADIQVGSDLRQIGEGLHVQRLVLGECEY